MIPLGFVVLMLTLATVRPMDYAPGVSYDRHESSDAYLRNVVSELQFLNGIVKSPLDGEEDQVLAPSTTTTTTTVTPAIRLDYHDMQANMPQTYRLPRPTAQITSKSVPSYSMAHRQIERTPTQSPMILGFTAADLASMYKKAIERGAAVKYQSLVNTIDHHVPKIFGSPYALADESRPPAPEPQYAYYFYPLQSFRHELMDPHGYHTIPNFQYNSAPTEITKKESSTMSPILMGISSFLGMALFFMLSLFFYPRVMHFMQFPFITTARGVNSELTNLTTFITEAIDHYNANYAKMKRNKSQLQREAKSLS